ncbi:MAG: AAA family ATPase, partial [Thermoplasmata archaeon]
DISGTKNLLLYGPKGCQKLSLLKAAGNEIGIPMRVITGMEFKEVVSEGGREVIDKLFDEMRDMAPSVMVISDIDKFAYDDIKSESERKVFESFLNLMKDFEEVHNITLIATSHYPDRLNTELFERGRFEKRIYIPEPNFKRREELFEIRLDSVPTEEDIDYSKLAEISKKYTSEDIKSCIEDAKIKALSRSEKERAKITQDDLEESIKDTQSSMKEEMKESSRRFKEEWD